LNAAVPGVAPRGLIRFRAEEAVSLVILRNPGVLGAAGAQAISETAG
jgi:hypothetical protein